MSLPRIKIDDPRLKEPIYLPDEFFLVVCKFCDWERMNAARYTERLGGYKYLEGFDDPGNIQNYLMHFRIKQGKLITTYTHYGKKRLDT